ncbi:autotransporter outer membrane beta-barrel domain-containing protein [Brucella pituitosa]|uniref:autotransporter family protein n=1 Tax=Brucella pituitosa TaxID=571256 RepID=UPI0009A254D1|nr:autotransporter outer membrane beta-barrel domain-containing protein [Brucella pituitosa]
MHDPFRMRRYLGLLSSVSALVLCQMTGMNAACAEPSITSYGPIFNGPAPGATTWIFQQVPDSNSTGVLIGQENGINADAGVVMTGGATAEGNLLWVGMGPNSQTAPRITGRLTVDGAGTTFTTHRQVIIAQGLADGYIDITNGAKFFANGDYNPAALDAGMVIGSQPSNYGQVTVSGQGSLLSTDAKIWIADFGDGALIVNDGAQVISPRTDIGVRAGSHGSASISGAGSSLSGVDGASFLTVGLLGAGELTVSNGGVVNISLLRIGYQAGSSGVVNIGAAQDAPAQAAGTLNVDHIEFNGAGGGSTGSLNFNITDSTTLHAVITGTGTINQIAGITTLTGDNSGFVGTVNLLGGTLSVADDNNIGDLSTNLTLDGGTLQVTGHAFASSSRAINLGDHGGGFDIADAANTFTVSQSLSGSGQLWKRGQGMLVLTGDNSFAGGLHVEAGTAKAGIDDHAFGSGILNVDAGATADLDAFNTSTGGLAGGGTVALNAATLTLAQDVNTVFSGTINGSGGLVKNGSGALTLSGSNSYSGATALNDGTLKQGAAGALSSASAYQVAQTGTLDLGGFSTNIASLNNQGNVNFSGTGGATLHVTGNYSGNGAITINSVLGGDHSKTDMLAVDGDTSGTTKLNVINQDGSGAQTVNGIKVVDVGGNSNGSFVLGNGYEAKDGEQAIVSGAYAYTLQQGGNDTTDDGDWYLVSHIDGPKPAPRYSAGAPLYEGYVQNMMALNKLPTLQQRVGNRYFAGETLRGSEDGGRAEGASFDARGVWARVEGAHNRLEPSTSTARMKQDINTLAMQTGVDGQFYENDQGRLIAGITAQYGHAKGDVSSQHGDGTITTDAWSLGATATWYGNDGFYLDGQGQVTWFDNDLDSSTANQSLANGRKATGYAVSLETGQQIALGGNWSLTPQAQLSWSSISANSFRDAWNARVAVDDGDSLIGRLGLAAQYATAWKDDQGRASQASLYGIANLYQEFLGGTTVDLSGVDFDTDNDRTWGGIGLGGSYAWADNKYALYGEGSVNTGLTHFADSYSLKANAGFKVQW